MTVQDITRLIVLPVIYTESKRCGANHTFLISFLAELSILHCNHSFFVFCFSDSGHSQPQVQSALLDRAYRERNNSGRTSFVDAVRQTVRIALATLDRET